MKNLTLLLSISILFQSCFSYKTVDYNNIIIVKKQKVELEKILMKQKKILMKDLKKLIGNLTIMIFHLIQVLYHYINGHL